MLVCTICTSSTVCKCICKLMCLWQCMASVECVCVFEARASLQLTALVCYQSDEWGQIFIVSRVAWTHTHTLPISKTLSLSTAQRMTNERSIMNCLPLCVCVCVSRALIDGDLLGKTKHWKQSHHLDERERERGKYTEGWTVRSHKGRMESFYYFKLN